MHMYIRDDDNSKSTGVIVSDLLVSINYRRQRLAAGGKRNADVNERDESALPPRIGLIAMWRRNVPMITRFCRTWHIYYARVSG